MAARALLAAVFTMLALPAAAQDCGQPILIVREDGIPVYNTPTKESYEEFHDYVRPHMGDTPSDRPILVIDIRTHHGAWVSRELLGKVVNMYDATVQDALLYKGPNHCRPKGIPWIPFDPAEPGREPIELFPDLAADTGPRSGLWRAEIGPTEVTGCPAMMRDAFPASAGALSGMTGDTRRMTFADPFHPDTLEMSRATGIRWNASGVNRWVSTDLAAETFAQIPAGTDGGSMIVLTLTVISPEEMQFQRSIEIVLPAVAATAMGVSPDGCQTNGTDRWVRVGD